jgi:Cu+-exporting ATPase
MVRKRFPVEGMHCVGCTIAVEGAVEKLAGVKRAEANYARQYVDVEYDEARVTEAEIVTAVERAGYSARVPA